MMLDFIVYFDGSGSQYWGAPFHLISNSAWWEKQIWRVIMSLEVYMLVCLATNK